MGGPLDIKQRPGLGAQPPPLSFDALKSICEDQVPKSCSGLDVTDNDVKFVISDLCQDSAFGLSQNQQIIDLNPRQIVLNNLYLSALKKQLNGAKCREIAAKVLERKQANTPPETAPAAESSMLDTTSPISPLVLASALFVASFFYTPALVPALILLGVSASSTKDDNAKISTDQL